MGVCKGLQQQGRQPALPELKENSSLSWSISKCVCTREGISQPDTEILQRSCKNLPTHCHSRDKWIQRDNGNPFLQEGFPHSVQAKHSLSTSNKTNPSCWDNITPNSSCGVSNSLEALAEPAVLWKVSACVSKPQHSQVGEF